MFDRLVRLLKPKPRPVVTDQDPRLGMLRWSDSEEGWTGRFNGIPFVLGYEDQASPDESVKSCAADLLADPRQVQEVILRAKRAAITAFPPSYRAEIDGLTLEFVSCFLVRGAPHGTLVLGGGREGRAWRLEWSRGEWTDLAFDD